MRRRHSTLAFGCLILLGCSPIYAQTSTGERRKFDIPSQDLKYALRAVTRTSGFELYARSEDLRGKLSTEMHAQLTVREALDQLLVGSGLTAEIEGKVVFIRGRSDPSVTALSGGSAIVSDIVVTGTHLAGGSISSSVVKRTQKEIIDAGQIDLGDVIRDIPQNFGGGQNPGIGFAIPTLSGENIGGGSAVNLRGLGQDATLTLINGHRRAYGATRESIDVSAIPLAALDRIEIVPDGASAIYGSDAVAGVANVILKRDYDGVSTSGTVGTTTDGGGTEKVASAIAGKKWSSGGFMFAYEYGHTNAISSNDRSFSADTSPNLTLIPSDEHHNAVFAGHLRLTDHLTFSLDSLFNTRHSSRQLAFSRDPASPIEINSSHTTAFSISPSLQWALPSAWLANLQSTYGTDRIHFGTDLLSDGSKAELLRTCDCNSTIGGELSASGHLISVAGHAVALAVGGGYKTDRLRVLTRVGGNDPIVASQDDWYTYGELELPFVAPQDSVPMVHEFKVNLAGRYESYSGVGHVATPKIGVLFSPLNGVDLKSSWGKSFRAPTLFERYVSSAVDAYATGDLGGTDFAPEATALVLSGGNPSLKPERATSWSETIAFHPASLEGLSIEVSYFKISYRNRVVVPITYLTNALNDAAYRPYLDLQPTADQIAAALHNRTLFIDTAGDFDPSTVVAVVNNDLANAATQKVHGFDLSAAYAGRLAGETTIALDADLSYLNSRQQTIVLQPLVALAGTLYNPPHVRGRLGATLGTSTATVSGHLNYTGPVHDVRVTPALGGRSTTTIDLAATYRSAKKSGALKGVRITAAAENIFNKYPGRISTIYAFEAPYDSTDYSPVGRRLSLTIAKDW